MHCQSIGANLALNSNLSVIAQTGDIQTYVSGTFTYNFTSNNTTPPTSTPIVISSSTSSTLAAGEVKWFSFQYNGGALTIDTEGSTLQTSNDTEIALFNSTGAKLKEDDESGTGSLSKITYAAGVLSAGTYYIAAAGYDTTFGAGFDASSASSYTGTLQLNLTGTPVPEPTTLAAIGIARVIMLRRRR